MRTMSDLSDEERRAVYVALVKGWDTKTARQLATELDVKRHVINGLATRLRKAGIPLRRKATQSSILTPDFVSELVAFYGSKG